MVEVIQIIREKLGESKEVSASNITFKMQRDGEKIERKTVFLVLVQRSKTYKEDLTSLKAKLNEVILSIKAQYNARLHVSIITLKGFNSVYARNFDLNKEVEQDGLKILKNFESSTVPGWTSWMHATYAEIPLEELIESSRNTWSKLENPDNVKMAEEEKIESKEEPSIIEKEVS